MVSMFYAINLFGNNRYFIKAFNGIKYTIISMVFVVMAQYFFKGAFEYKFFIFFGVGVILALFNLHPAYIVILVGLLSLFI